MIQREIGSLVRQVIQLAILSGCIIGLMAGCSSRLRTTIVSGDEPPKVQVTQLEPETVAVEEVLAAPSQQETRMDIPVELPASPAPRSELPTEIFAASKSSKRPTEVSPFSGGSPADEPLTSSIPSQETRIPPMAFDPEMPPLPQGSTHGGSSITQDNPVTSVAKPEPPVFVPPTVRREEPPAVQEPVQVAKVMPQDPEQPAIITTTLDSALSDIFFDYDQFAIRDDAETLLKANAQLLSEKLIEKQIVIEGHCDERGTQSYNMVLGERRAKAVKHFLEDLGVPAGNIQVVSYGKDKPFCTEQSEACWQENRRGHFVIK